MLSPELFREMDARGEIKRKLSKAPFKDTVPLPNGGYVIIRFVADNPGEHFLYCSVRLSPLLLQFDWLRLDCVCVCVCVCACVCVFVL